MDTLVARMGGSALVALMGIVPVMAQQSDAADDGGLTEIIVTAQKVVSTAQRTPIAMSVFDSQSLTENGIGNVNALANIAPTLNIAQNNQSSIITIRGVSSRDYTETGDPAVAVSIDNFYLQNAVSLNAGMFDLERVEVLRGPQGTLYGRNATAGAINIRTARPTDRLEGNISAEYGYNNALITEGMVNAPVSDTLIVRGAFSVHQRKGYVDNGSLETSGGTVTKNGNDDVSQSGRLHVLWQPGRFSALVTGEVSHVGGVGSVIKSIPYADVRSDGTLELGDTDDWALNNQASFDLDVKTVRTELNYDLDFATVSYYGGYRDQHQRRDNDQDGSTAYSYAFPTDGQTDTQNHELRITSNNDGPFGWQGGIYAFQEQLDALTYFQVVNGGTRSNFYTFDYDTKAKSQAAFGQVYFNPVDSVKLSAGARYTKEDKSQLGYNIIAGTYTAVDAHYSGHKDTYHAGVDWQVTPRSLIYAKYDTGFKSGGFQNGYAFGPETIEAWEAGTKNRLFDNRLELNANAFLYNYSDLQVQQNDPVTAISRIYNAGEAEIYGTEVEGNWLVTADDRVDFSVAYLHARYKDFLNNGVQYSGNTLPQAPTWSLSGGYQHQITLENGLLTARIQSRYQTKSFFSFRNSAAEQQKAYTKTDLNVTYEPDQSNFVISAYVRNIEDSTILTTSEEAAYAGGYLVQFADPRTWGVRVSYKF